MNKINICILTHGRPALFKRCINSINENIKTLNTIQQTAYNFIILCDDNSVNSRQVKLNSDNVKFISVEEPEDISENYKRLFEESLEISKDCHTYFIEDNDFLLTGALRLLLDAVNNTRKFEADNYLFNYSHGYGKDFDANFINNFHFLKYNNYNGKIFPVKEFIKKYDDRNYQLGMLLFKNSSLDIKDFPKGNYLENDFSILKILNGSIRCSSTKIYQQGFFNKESKNISDSNNKKINLNSLKDYAK